MTYHSAAPDGEDKEVDLSEILSIAKPLFYSALVIALLCGAIGFIYSYSQDKVYTATAQFTIEDENKSAPSFGNLEALISPVGGASSPSTLVKDRIMARDFIVGLFSGTGAHESTLLPESFSNTALPKDPEIIQGLVSRFREDVSIQVAQNQLISVMVKHGDPDGAATLANEIVRSYLTNLDSKRDRLNDEQIEQMRKRLTKVREDLDDAVERTRIFSLQNDLRPVEALNRSSAQLTSFRREVNRLDTALDALKFLEERSATATTVPSDELFSSYTTAFALLERRLDWTAEQPVLRIPNSSTIERLRLLFSEERDRLERSIQLLEEGAAESSFAARKLMEFNRDIAVQEALYKGLLEQFESRSIGVEMTLDQGDIVQTATPPLVESGPKVFTNAGIAAVLGGLLFMGAGLGRMLLSNKLFTRNQMTRNLGHEPLIQDIAGAVGKRKQRAMTLLKAPGTVNNAELLNYVLGFKERGSKWLTVMGLPADATARNFAAFLAGSLADGENSTALIDLCKTRPKNKRLADTGTFVSSEPTPGITILTWEQSTTNAETLEQALDRVSETYDRIVVLCAQVNDGVLRNNSVLSRTDESIILANRGVTTQENAKQARAALRRFPDMVYRVMIA